MRGKGGYVGEDSVPRLNVLDLQMQIRRLPKPVVAMVAGYAVGGGHILHMVCDLTVSSWQPCAHRPPAGQLPLLHDKQLVYSVSALMSCAMCAPLWVVVGLCQD